MDNWSIISDPEKFYLGYFPGSGGSRMRRLLLDRIWKHNPGLHLHQIDHAMRDMTTDAGIPKCPEPWYIDWTTVPPTSRMSPAIDLEHKILTGHAMHIPTITQVFPGRKTIKIYSNLKSSLRRWWVVFGKHWHEQHNPPMMNMLHLSYHPMTPVEHAIKSHLDYYSKLMDCDHDYAIYILPGESEFADFMLEEFDIIRGHPDAIEFDRCWNDIINDPRWIKTMFDPLLMDPEFCRNRRKYLDSVAKTS